MTRHSTVFEVERPVPVNDIVKDLQPETHKQSNTDDSPPAAAAGKRFNFRKALMAGAAVAVLAGAA
jgi:membrane fusion protein (multidrug efflux system)